MTDKDKSSKARKDFESEVWSAISAFEQILEAMPNDRASLEALAQAYEQIGDHTKAREYYIRLGTVLLEEADAQAAVEVLPKIREIAEVDESAKTLAQGMEKLAQQHVATAAKATAAEKERKTAKGGGDDASSTGFNVADELAFAWNLMEANEISQEEYSNIVQDLTELSAAEKISTVSVLHILEARAFRSLDKIMTFVSKACGAPIIALPSFDFPVDAVSLLRREFVIRRGVMVFEFLGKDALAVVMNPYDKKLQKEVEDRVGRKCHFYMCLPSDFDKAVEKMDKVISDAHASDKK